MKRQKLKVTALITVIMLAISLINFSAYAAIDFSKFATENGAVTLDGTNPGTVTVYWKSIAEQKIAGFEGKWSLKEDGAVGSANKLTLTEISSEVVTFAGLDFAEPTDGRTCWRERSFDVTKRLSLANGTKILAATYSVAADTPAGTYTVKYKSEVLTGEDYNPDTTETEYEASIVVTRPAPVTHPAKPTINVTGTYTYNGAAQTATVEGYDSATMNITGNVGQNAGNYTVSVTSKTGKWADNSTDAVTKGWSIAKADPAVTNPTGLVGMKFNALSTVALPLGWAWEAPATIMNAAGNQSFAAIYTPNDTTNYNTLTASLTVNVAEPPAKPTINVTGTYTYNGADQTAAVEGYDSATMNITGNVGRNAGNYTVSVTSKTGKWADGTTDAVTKGWSIAKKTVSDSAKTAAARAGAEGTLAIDASELPSGYSLGTLAVTDADSILDGVPTMTATVLKFKFKADAAAGKTAEIKIPVSSTNIADYNIAVTVTVSEKNNQAALEINCADEVVYGNTLTLTTTGGSGTGAVEYAVTNGTGMATVAGDVLTPVKAGKVTVIATKAADADYNAISSVAFEVTIKKATPTGAPKYTAITEAGKTLGDAALTTTGATFSVPGAVKWVDDDGNELSAATVVTANTEYKWLFTPADTDNYEVLRGTARPYYVSSGSRRSASSSATAYTVSFETNGGSAVSKRSIAKNTALKEPTAPTKEGFDFAGWYTDKELKTKYDFSAKVTKAFTLYAKWTEKDNSINQIILTIGKKDAKVFGKATANDVAPKIVNSRTMLPARFVAESLGAKVDWNGKKELVTITGRNEKGEEVTILITIGAANAVINGEEVKLDSPAFIENDRTYTPIRFISEQLGATVDWDDENQVVTITKAAENK